MDVDEERAARDDLEHLRGTRRPLAPPKRLARTAPAHDRNRGSPGDEAGGGDGGSLDGGPSGKRRELARFGENGDGVDDFFFSLVGHERLSLTRGRTVNRHQATGITHQAAGWGSGLMPEN